MILIGVTSRQNLVLKATGASTAGGAVTSYKWSARSEAGARLSDAMILNSLNSNFLVIKAGSFPQGHVISLVMSCEDSSGNVGSSYLDLLVNTPPAGGPKP